MERIDYLDAIAKMLVHLSDEDVKTVYEFISTMFEDKTIFNRTKKNLL